ncbi:AAA family ATPase [Dietzia maris]|uniref:AAA family ATPase n=1 Tax=Dietzia maris TaxID=37915 RepID=UPI0037C95FA3
MEISELRLNNWGPFYGEQAIPLDVEPSAPVILFHGENMRGKTSLLRAIIWCLYGQLKEQNGRTALPVEKMVNLDALEEGETTFGVVMSFSHDSTDFVLHRTGRARRDGNGKAQIDEVSVDLKPVDGQPYPAANVPNIVDSIISQDVSDFFFFDGEMLNRFEERLREERSSSQSFVRSQVEKALGLPFMSNLVGDLEEIRDRVNVSVEQAARRSKKHDDLTAKFRRKKDELKSADDDISALASRMGELDGAIEGYEDQLSKVAEVRELFYERKALEGTIAQKKDEIRDLKNSLAEFSDIHWWLPAGEMLSAELEDVESQILEWERSDRDRIRLQVKLEELDKQLGSGVCPACGQPVSVHDREGLEEERSRIAVELEQSPASGIDEARRRRDKLRLYAGAKSVIERVREQEQDLRRARMQLDRAEQSVLEISEKISSNNVNIDVVEQRLAEAKANRQRFGDLLNGLEEKRAKLKAEANRISGQIADSPEVDDMDRLLMQVVSEAHGVVSDSFDLFRRSMRDRVSSSASDLFRRLTTEKEYSGVRISEDYLLSVVDHRGRALSMISAGANQILTMAFIGALAECSVDKAPMVMDTPFGRLDMGHRSAVLTWVKNFESQVILFVQSGEYEADRDAHLLAGKIGREFRINRLTPNQSEVVAL